MDAALQHMRNSTSRPCKKNASEGSRLQALLCSRQEEKREEENEKKSKRKERPVNKWVHKRQVGVTKASRLVLPWILLGTRMQRVKAVEKEIYLNTPGNGSHDREDSRMGGGIRYKTMRTCDRGWRAGGDWEKQKVKTGRERTQRPKKKTARVETLKTPNRNKPR